MLKIVKNGKEVLEKLTQTNTLEDRAELAQVCTATLKLSIPVLIDKADNKVNQAYAAWPDRLAIVGLDGKIAYMGGPGPREFKTDEVEKWLKANVK